MTEKIIGVDLGTTFSAVAAINTGTPAILPKGDQRIIPSVVGISPEGELLVGTPGRNQYIVAPERTVRSIKRKMGTDERVMMAGKSYTPQEISALIVREMKSIAEANLRQPVGKAVITVPAYFDDAQRQATKDAGEIAGLEVVRIINEPTAAALAYGLDREEDLKVMVYDLGGGTFDVSIIQLHYGIVEVLSTAGDNHLGGDDFDERLAELLADEFEDGHGIDLRQDRRAWARLVRAAEECKIELSDQPFAWVRLEYLAEKDGKSLHLRREVSRQEFVDLIRDLVESTLGHIDRALADAELSSDDIDKVLLVGGSTRMPFVWELVTERMEQEPHLEINPDEAVALGASVQAGIIAGEDINAILVDVTPHSLGIETAYFTYAGRVVGDLYSVLIHRNTTIPTTKAEVYSTLFPDQDAIHLKIYQGEDPKASRNTLLGDFTIEGLKPERPGERAKVTVEFGFDVDGILHVQATDRQTGKEAGIAVEASRSRLSAEEIARARERVTARDGGGEEAALDEATAALIARARRVLDGDLPPEDALAVEELIGRIRHAAQQGDKDAEDGFSDELVDLLFDLEAEA
ncbi:MAG: Hsp70 family protein [Anaerolineae bacterium]